MLKRWLSRSYRGAISPNIRRTRWPDLSTLGGALGSMVELALVGMDSSRAKTSAQAAGNRSGPPWPALSTSDKASGGSKQGLGNKSRLELPLPHVPQLQRVAIPS